MKRFVVAMVVALAVVFSFSMVAYSSTDMKVNINTASVAKLSSLKKVGEKVSQRIVEYRETMGPFETPEDIMNVKGIGDKVFDMNKERIVIKDEAVERKS